MHFRKKMIPQNFCYFFPHGKNSFLESGSWQFYVKKRMWRVNYFSFMLNYGQKILILNSAIPPCNFKIKFSETLCKTKILHESFGAYGQDRFSVLLQKFFWSSSFWDIYCDIYRPQRTKLMPPGYFLSEVFAKLVHFQKINWVKLVRKHGQLY